MMFVFGYSIYERRKNSGFLQRLCHITDVN